MGPRIVVGGVKQMQKQTHGLGMLFELHNTWR